MRLSLTSRCLVVLGIMLCASTALAHEVRPALFKLDELGEGRWQAEFKQPQVQGRFLNLKVKSNCEAGKITTVVGQSALKESFELKCADDVLRVIEIEGLERTLVDTMVSIESLNGKTSNYLISSNQPTLFLRSSEESAACRKVGHGEPGMVDPLRAIVRGRHRIPPSLRFEAASPPFCTDP